MRHSSSMQSKQPRAGMEFTGHCLGKPISVQLVILPSWHSQVLHENGSGTLTAPEGTMAHAGRRSRLRSWCARVANARWPCQPAPATPARFQAAKSLRARRARTLRAVTRQSCSALRRGDGGAVRRAGAFLDRPAMTAMDCMLSVQPSSAISRSDTVPSANTTRSRRSSASSLTSKRTWASASPFRALGERAKIAAANVACAGQSAAAA